MGKPTPSALINNIIKYILSLHLAKDVENSYIANLKKVDGFMSNGQRPQPSTSSTPSSGRLIRI